MSCVVGLLVEQVVVADLGGVVGVLVEVDGLVHQVLVLVVERGQSGSESVGKLLVSFHF